MPTFALLPLLRGLHRRGRLVPLLHEAAAEQLVLDAAVGITVADAELQRAADHFRQRHGLHAAADTHAWLQRQGLTALDLQTTLEHDVLIYKFKDRLAAERGAEHFAAHRDRYARARLRLLVTASEGEARELRSRITDDGADFAELARSHSLHSASRGGGLLGIVFRGLLPAAAADVVFNERPGRVAGPVAGEGGFCLFLVEEILPAELDETTKALIRTEIFAAWLRERMIDVQIDLSWLSTDGTT